MLLASLNLPKSLTFLWNFCEGIKIYHFLVKSFLGKFYRHLEIFSGHTDWYIRWNIFDFLILRKSRFPSKNVFKHQLLGESMLKIWPTPASIKIFLKGPFPPSFFFYFCVFFKQTFQFMQQIMWKTIHPGCSIGIRTHDLSNMRLVP